MQLGTMHTNKHNTKKVLMLKTEKERIQITYKNTPKTELPRSNVIPLRLHFTIIIIINTGTSVFHLFQQLSRSH